MRLLGLMALIAYLVDQGSKYAVLIGLDLRARQAIDVFPPYLNFRMAWNRGVNFGLLSNGADVMRWLLVALGLGISAWIVWWMARSPHSALARASAGLLIGGALGNVTDRVVFGAVVDFLNMSCCGIDNPFAFNLADVAVFAGALGLVLFTGQKNTP